MSVKIPKYLLVLFLILSVLIIGSGVVNASCYVKSLDCSPDSASCTNADILAGTCAVYPGPSDGSCSPDTIELCQAGCCCVGSTANTVFKGFCDNKTSSVFYPQSTMGSNQCGAAFCTTHVSYNYNITGYVKIGNVIIKGASISIDGRAAILTDSVKGNYSFIDVPSGTRTIVASSYSCSVTTSPLIDKNEEINVSLNCLSVNVSGHVTYADTAQIVPSPNVTIFMNDVYFSKIFGADGFYNFSVPYNTPATLSARDNSGCGSDNIDIATGNQNIIQDITLSCKSYSVSGTIISDGTISNSDVEVKGISVTNTTNNAGAYSLNGLSGGQVNVTAKKTITQESSVITCTNYKIISLIDNNLVRTGFDITLGADNCCNKTVTPTTCGNDGFYDVITKYTDNGHGACGGKTQETQSNIPCNGLPPCPLVCDTWQGDCNVAGTTTRVCTASSIHPTDQCNSALSPIPIDLYEPCNSKCGNGILDSGEDCDYVFGTDLKIDSAGSCASTWQTISNTYNLGIDLQTPAGIAALTENQKATICNAAKCTCGTQGQQGSDICDASPGGIASLNIYPVEAQPKLELYWTMKPVCTDYIDHFELRRCNNKTGACLQGYNELVNRTINKKSLKYNDTNIVADSQYCYKLTVVFNDSIPEEHKTASITSCDEGANIGIQTCASGAQKGWCAANVAVNCNANNFLDTNDCSLMGAKCKVVNDFANCTMQAPCDLCNEMFGIFGYQSYIIDTGDKIDKTDPNSATYKVLCPSLQLTPVNNRAPLKENWDPVANIDGCYVDYSRTTVDKVYSCNKTNSCYDYFSESSCTLDYCGKFTLQGINQCEWTNQTAGGQSSIFKKGVCRPKAEEEQQCGYCNNISKYNRIDYVACSKNTCENLFGNCYFEPKTEKCLSRGNLTCNIYTSPDECTGGRNVSTDVQWTTSGFDEFKNSGTHIRINSSDGSRVGGTVGICKWDNESKISGQYLKDLMSNDIAGKSVGCFRDVDNYTGSLGGKDCIMPSAGIATEALRLQYLSLCEHDTIPPITNISNSPKYGLLMNLTDQINVTDNNPWGLGDNFTCGPRKACRYIRLYYCIVPEGNPECYPKNILPITSGLPYTINLSNFKDKDNLDIGGVKNNGDRFTIYYFSEDPAKNLEYPKKHFSFEVDTTEPNISASLDKNSYQVPGSDTEWLTNLTVTLRLEAIPAEGSVPVTCSFKVLPVGDTALYFQSQFEDQYNIPSKANPSANKMYTSGSTISTKYPGMIDGFYKYEMDCFDSVGNHLYKKDILFNITGNVLINNPQPFMHTPYNGTNPIISSGTVGISVDTSVPGKCGYARVPYKNLTAFTTTDNLHHSSTVNVPLLDASGIYKYYVLCNITINGKIYNNVRGSDMANPIFAIDTLPPITKIRMNDLSNNNWPYYNETDGTYSERAAIRFECNDSYPTLTMPNWDMSFGCKETYYCISPRDNPTFCEAVNSNSYKPVSELADGIILFDYSEGQFTDKDAYGNSPTIYYYSMDNGGNSDVNELKTITLRVKNTQIKDPTMEVLLGPDGKTTTVDLEALPGINESFVTVDVNYVGETDVTITNYTLTTSNSNGNAVEVPIEAVDGLTGQNEYKFTKAYIDNGVYTFTVTGVDDDGNNVTDHVTFRINHTGNIISLVSPKLGIGITETYEIIVNTTYPSECKYNTESLDTVCPNNNCKWYANSTPESGLTADQLYKSFTTTGSNTHKFYYSTAANGEGMLYVICKTVGSSDAGDSFVTTSFHVGYNDIYPELNITFIQNPKTWPEDNSIINKSYNATIVQVVTDQPSVCAISSTNANKKVAINPPKLFQSAGNTENYLSYDNYYTIHTYLVNFSNTGETDGTFTYTIDCTNMAQLTTSNDIDIVLNTGINPPVMNIIPDFKSLTIRRYNITCTGLCMNVLKNTYESKVVGYDESCDESTPYTEANYSDPVEIIATSKICVKGTDILGRSGNASLPVQMVSFKNGPIVVKYPYVYTYKYGNVDIANRLYSPTKNTTLVVNTTDFTNGLDITATCKILPLNYINDEDTWEKIYNIDTTVGDDYRFSQTDSTTHSTALEITPAQNLEDVWEVVCHAADANPNSDQYFGKELFLYWDDSSPSISADANPEHINDWKDHLRTILSSTTDDNTMCNLDLTKSSVTVTNKTSNITLSERLNYTEDIFTESMDTGLPELFVSYVKERSHTYNLPNKWRGLNSLEINATYNFFIDCWNRALLHSSDIANMTYDLDNHVTITRTSDNVSASATIPFNVTTNIFSDCVASIDAKNNVTLVSSDDGLYHKTDFTNVSIGSHIVNVYCGVTSNGNIAPAHETYTLFVDITPPNIISWNASVKNSLCTVDGLDVIFTMYDDVGIEGYSYYISGPEITPELVVIHSNSTNGTISFDNNLPNDKTYTVDIIISDSSGKQSNKSISITTSRGAGVSSCNNGCLDPGEDCDSNTTDGLNGYTCKSFIGGGFVGGQLRCTSSCTFEKSKCDTGKGWCGDGKIQGPNSIGQYEQCDGGRPAGLTCKNFGFTGGTLDCNDDTCMVNTSRCIDSSSQGSTPAPKCSNQLLETGEQCEAGQNVTMLCTYFGYDGGIPTCGTAIPCMYDLSKCYITAVVTPDYGGSVCGNNITEGAEKCDGTSGLSTVSCRSLGNFTGGTVTCNKNNCTYNISNCVNNVSQCSDNIKEITEADVDCGGTCLPCGLNKTCFADTDCSSGNCGYGYKCAANTCFNNVWDSNTETDVDCGKNCTKTCELDKNCLINNDCKSGYCIDSKCSLPLCSNGVKDEGEVDIDCGGDCVLCEAGKVCNSDTDCATGLCKKNICVDASAAPEGNPVKIPLMIVGLVLSLAGAGYIIYKTFIAKPVSTAHGGQFSGRPPMGMPRQEAPATPMKLTPEQEEMMKKQREAMVRRRQARADERKGVIDKLGESSSEDAKKDEASKEATKDESKKKSGKAGPGKPDSDEFLELSELKETKTKNRKDTFEKLKSLNINETAKKIATLSGTEQSDIKPTLSNNTVSDTAAIKMFGEIDRDTIMSGAFKDVISDLLNSKKITKEHVSNILFEYMDKGLLSKGDVAKLSSELKIIEKD